MKRLLGVVLAAAVLVPRAQVRAGDEAEWLGAALGAGIGLIVADNSRHVDALWAVPLGAVAGGLVAHGVKDAVRRGGDDGYAGPYYGGFYGPSYYRNPYRYSPRYYGHRPYRVERLPPPRLLTPQEAAPEPNLTPGVDLVKVNIALKNGIRFDINLLRVGDKFVGPRGEEYKALPTAKELEAKYGG